MPQPGTRSDAGRELRAAAQPPSGRRRHPADDVDLVLHDLERFAAEYRAAVDRGHTHGQVHDFEERAQAIAAAILSPFRGPAQARPVNPPLWRNGNTVMY